MDRESFIKMLSNAKLFDLTQGCSIFTPPWPIEKALEVHFFKRLDRCLWWWSWCKWTDPELEQYCWYPPGW